MVNRFKSFHGLNKKYLEKYLEEKANKGLFLVSSSNIFLKFEESAPKDIKYYAYPCYRHKAFSYGTEFPNDSLSRKMAESGYTYVTSNSFYQIFSSEDLTRKPDINEDELGHDTLKLLLKTDLLMMFLLAVIFLIPGSNYSKHFPSVNHISVLNQMSLIMISIKILLISAVAINLVYDLTWVIVNNIRKKSVWYPDSIAIKVKNIILMMLFILGFIIFLSGFVYDDEYWKLTVLLMLFTGVPLSFRFFVDKVRTSKSVNIIMFLVLIILLSVGGPYLMRTLFDEAHAIEETTLLDLNSFGYENLYHESQRSGKSILVPHYEVYFTKGEQEEVLSVHINCINKSVLDHVVHELIKEYDLKNNTKVEAGILNSYLRYSDSEYMILVKNNDIYFLSGDIDITNKEHQLIINNKLIQ